MRLLKNFLRLFPLSFALLLVYSSAILGQDAETPQASPPIDLADVFLDGVKVFEVLGVNTLPAAERAENVRQNLIKAANMSERASVKMEIQDEELGHMVVADGVSITLITSRDAEFVGLERELVAKLISDQVRNAIIGYRSNRTNEGRLGSLFDLIVVTLFFAGISYLIFYFRKRAANWVEHQVSLRLANVDEVTGEIVRSNAIATVARQTVYLIFAIVFLTLLYYYLSVALYSFAETRGIATILLNFITIPIFNVFSSILSEIPSMIALTVIVLLAAYLVKLLRLVFLGVEQGTFKIDGFEKQWIWPTYNLARALIVIFTLVLAYPYIPGSGSEAFKGASIVLGVMVSLGSSSVIGNLLAGVFIIYKRSTNIGDRIKVDEHVGDVVAIKMMETHLKSIKNELISIPNAKLLNSNVINYSTKVDGRGLLVYTTVGIGYEEPQRKVEALLIEAANRTKRLKKTPPPFVLRMELADYAVVYQINAFTSRGETALQIKSDLHEHILDVFSEADVQIMTPSYVADPEIPKVPPTLNPEKPKATKPPAKPKTAKT